MSSSASPRLAIAAAVLLLFLIAAPSSAVVFTVSNVNDAGAGSLRQAILDSEANAPGPNQINFNIVGVPPFIITPLSTLPTITVPVFINGMSQPGSVPNTSATTDNAVLTIVLDGLLAGNGLTITANGCVIQGLVIEDFGTNLELASDGNTVQGCFFGVDATGLVAAVGGGVNILINGGADNQIGGPNPGDRNIISANLIGLSITTSSAEDNTVQGNFIGLASDGTTALPNGYGIYLANAPDNTVGGTTSGAGNVISGNTDFNIFVLGASASGNVIAGNLIGTDASGTAAAGSSTYGVYINDAPDNTVGGTTSAAGNVISGGVYGVTMVGAGATGNVVEFNKIGTDITGVNSIANALGVWITGGANGNLIGEGNIIAFSTFQGVLVDGAGTNNNTITQNSIFSNGTLGIELINTGNDSLPAPVLTSVGSVLGVTTINGTLNVPTEPTTDFTLEFFYGPVCEAGGKVYLGSATVTTDGSGFVSFTETFSAALPTGTGITATATDPAGNTSEFSNCPDIEPAPDLVVTKTAVYSPIQAGTDQVFIIKVTNQGTASAANVTVSDIVPIATMIVGACYASQGIGGFVGNNVTADLGTLGVGATATVSIIAQVKPTVPNGTRIYNTATAATTTAEPVTGNNTSTTSFFVSNTSPLGLQMFVDLVSGNPTPPRGTTQTYVYRVTLKANNAVYGVTASANVPGLLSLPTASKGTVKSYGGPTPSVIWLVSSMLAGEIDTLLVTVRLKIPTNAPYGSLFQVASPWSATYYFAASKKVLGPTSPINVIVTRP